MSLFTKSRVKHWTKYSEVVDEVDVKVGGRSTERLHFINLTQENLSDVKELGESIKSYIDEIATSFYANLVKETQLIDMIKEHSTIERLKVTMKRYIEQLLQNDIDHDYIASRVIVGEVHSRINLTANYFIMAHNTLIQHITAIIIEKFHKHPDKMARYILAIQKKASFDQQLIVDVYHEATYKSFLYDISEMLNEITYLNTTQQLVEAMEEQIEETNSVTAATVEMSSSIQDVSNHAVKVAEGTEEAVQTAENSRRVIDEALYDIEEVGSVYNIVINDVNHLGNAIENTHEVINVIKEIADQTNLLALNASIEAARAGEYGKGFAVVATEVRKLSEHTKEQIEQITKNLGTLQDVAKQVTDRIEQTGVSVEKSVAGSQQAGKELANIVATMQNINQETSQIAAMSEEQSSTVMEISERNENMFELGKRVQRLSEETAQIIFNLSKDMNRYRLSFVNANLITSNKVVMSLAKTDHLLWKWNIYNMLLGFEQISRENVTSHHACRLGQWYYGEMAPEIKQLDAFKNLETPHKQVHDYAHQAVEHYERGNIDDAKLALERLESSSEEVVKLLETIERNL